MSLLGSHSDSTRLRSGSAMRSSASGHTGGHSVWKGRATGWLERCTWKGVASTSTTWSTTATRQSSASRTCYRCSRRRSGTPRRCWRDTSGAVQSTSLPLATITTTTTSGIQSTSHGTQRTSARSATSSPSGRKQPRRWVCHWASLSMPTTRGRGTSLRLRP